MKKAISRWASGPLVILSAVLLLLASCTPAWFPDGESFVSVGPLGDIAIHHIATKRTVKLSATPSTPGGTAAAVSPDGKTIAVTQIVSSGPAKTLSVRWVFYDADGKFLSKTEPSALKKTTAGDTKGEVPAFLTSGWSPDGKTILASFTNGEGAFALRVETKTVIEYEGIQTIATALAAEVGWMHHYPPCLPDGRGFLASKEGEIIVQLWDPEKSEPIKTQASAKEIDVAKMMKGDSKLGLLLSPYWKDNQFTAPFANGNFAIDTKAREFRFEKNVDNAALNEFAIKEEIAFLHQFRNGSLLGVKIGGENHQLYHFDAMQKSAVALTLPDKESSAMIFTPSPKNDRTIVSLFGKKNQLIVANEKGELIYRYDDFRATP